MELKEFIKRALIDIVDGVDEANKEKDCFRLTGTKNQGTNELGTKVEFDVAVEISKASDSDLKGGIKVAIVDFGGGTRESDSNQKIQKIKFDIFIIDKKK